MKWVTDMFHRLRRPEPHQQVTVRTNPGTPGRSGPPAVTFCDIHTHVLYGLDDGSSDLASSLQMLRMAVDHGTTDLVASPHSDRRFKYDREKVDAQIAELSEQMNGSLRLYRGCDFHLSFDNINDALKNPRKYTLNGQEYLLVEFPDTAIASNAAELLKNLTYAGMRPVITHPERNPILRTRIGDLTAWVEAGALIQVTAQSFQGRFGRRAEVYSWELLRLGLVHFIASDAHDIKHRPTPLDECYQLVRDRTSPAIADALFHANGLAALRGEKIQTPAVSR